MKHALRILIVDDSPNDAALIVRQLQSDFFASYDRVETAQEMEAALEKGGWHLIISDYVMPKFSGLSALQILHESGIDLPFIMVSGQMGEDAAVEAMRAGAHDYLLKDRLSRLVPAIKRELNEAVVRRERRMAEDALSATEARFQSLVEQSLVGIFLLQDDIFSYVNPKFAETFGYRPEQLVESKTLVDLVTRDDQIRVITQFLRPLREQCESLHFFFSGRRSDQSVIDLEVSGTRTQLNGNPAVIGTLLDITERKRAEAELSKLWRAVEQSPVSVVIPDLQGKIEYVNPKFVEVSGYMERELVGQSTSLLKSGTMDGEFYRDLWQTISSGREWHGELQNKKKCGELFWESASISAVKNSEGKITHFVGVKEDITERRQAIEQLRQVQKMEAVGQLAGGVAHDFNNLLTVINGYSTLLIRSLDGGSPMRKEAEQILRAGERAADLTRQLLSFSRRQMLEPKVLDMNHQVRAVEKMLTRLIGENILLETRLSDDLGQIKIDPGQFEQVVMNLVVNARDASETGGGITIETANCEIDEPFTLRHPGAIAGSYVRIAVSDQGQGMTEEVKRRLFEPFFTTKEIGKGTGLGLATVYGIMSQNGGFVEVASEPGQGTALSLYFPRLLSEPAGVPATPQAVAAADGCVLLVEDEPTVRLMAQLMLERIGYSVLVAASPQEALEKCRRTERIDCLLTDVVMPGMNGVELSVAVRAILPGLGVVYMSGYSSDMIAHHGVLAQGVIFLQKPFDVNALTEKIQQAMSFSRTA